ncbi:hypothetical protein LguiB_027950 [Lonicera macranthoides]
MGFLENSLKQIGIEKLSMRDTLGLFLEEFKKKIDHLIQAAEYSLRAVHHFRAQGNNSLLNKYYKDATLVHLFMANNLHYVAQVIRKSPELEDMIGEEYMNKLSENYLRQAISNYQSATYEKMLYCLRDEEERLRLKSVCFSSRGTFRRKVRPFNAAFEKIRSTQAGWVV